MQPDNGRVVLRGIVSRRQVDIKVARLSEGIRPDAAVIAVIVSVIHDFAGQTGAMAMEAKMPELAAGLKGRGNEEKCKENPQDAFHNDAPTAMNEVIED